MRAFGAASRDAGGVAMAWLSERTLQHPTAGGALRLVAETEPLGGVARDAFLVLGLSRTTWGPFALPLDLGPIGAPGVSLCVSLDMLVPVPAHGTEATDPRAIRDPGATSWLVNLDLPAGTPPGTQFGLQLVVIAPGYNRAHVAASNALWCTVGAAAQ